MSQRKTMNNRKCARCGVINFAEHEACRRCGTILTQPYVDASALSESATYHVWPRLLALAGTITAFVFVCWTSLLLTSEGLNPNQREVVARAITLLSDNGFSQETFFLRHLTTLRTTDNWWNRYVGHHQAYAATNFPFEVVTLYTPFFEVAADDTERAIILLHEARHLLGEGEDAALGAVWRAKTRVGWTAAAYGHTRVWKNTREWTHTSLPHLFVCDGESQSDCLE